MERIRTQLLEIIKKHRQVLLCVMASIAFTAWAIRPSEQSSDASEAKYDTFIPRGFVLVPIEVENFAALEGIVGSYTVVDLYVLDIAQPRLVAKNLRMLKSPTTAGQYAVLTPENEAPRLMKSVGPYRVVVQNPANTTTQFAGPGGRRIVFERTK